MAFGILIIGDEILSGRRTDKHFPKAVELLKARGLNLSWARYCGDERPLLTEMLRQTFASGDVVFSFGGIGATPDDHTRQCAAAALGVDIALHADAEREIRARFGDDTNPQRLIMGELPVGSEIVPNPYNRIPGFCIRQHWFLPGFPEMSWPMMEWVLDTHYAQLHNARPWLEKSIAVLHTHESQLLDLMTDWQNRFGVTIFSLPSLGGGSGRRHIELGAKGAPDAVEAAMIAMQIDLDQAKHPWCEMDALHAALERGPDGGATGRR